MNSSKKFKLAVIPVAHVGHVNPLLAMVKVLVDTGVDVVVFGQASIREAILKSGARYISLYDGCFDDTVVSPEKYFIEWKVQEGHCLDKFGLIGVQEASLYIEPLIRNIQLENPDAILHDTLCVEAYVVSKVLHIPLISHISYSGMGMIGDHYWEMSQGCGWEDTLNEEEFKKWRDLYLQKYNVDIWRENLPVQYYSKDLIITTMNQDLCLALNEKDDRVAFDLYKERQAGQFFVGPCLNETVRMNGNPTALPQDEIVEENPVPLMLKAKKEGKKIILVSFGTVITMTNWDVALFPVGGIGTGKAFYQTVVSCIVDGLGDHDAYLVVMATGLKAKGIESGKPLPSNFILCKRFSQTELLKLSDCFISHMGANSMNEAFHAGVPMVPVPGFADQPLNGKLTIQAGAGYAEWSQEASGVECTAEGIARSVRKVLDDPSFAANSRRLGAENRKAGGPKKAAEVIVSFIAQKKTTSGDSGSSLRRLKSCGTEDREVAIGAHTPVTRNVR